MKFLIHANGPTVKTGYGVQCKHLVDYLVDELGHEVAVSVTYGHQYGVGRYRTPGGTEVILYPSGYVVNSPDTLVPHADHFFELDRSNPEHWIITLLDVWCLLGIAEELRGFNVASWVPVDHFPVPPQVGEFLSRSGARPLAMSRFGEAQLRQAGLDPYYLPLTVADGYEPTYSLTIADRGKVTARELYGLEPDQFVVGMVAMNKDPHDRKGFNEGMRAFGQLWKRHNEARLLIHTEKYGIVGGLDLPMLAAYSGVPEHAVIFTEQYAYRLGLSTEMMAAFYTAMDVLLSPSHGEGFGVPLVEAQACGVPVVATDFSAQSELVGPGWAVHGQPWWDNSQKASYVIPHIFDITDKLELAYKALSDEEKSVELASACLQHAERYRVRTVFDELLKPWVASLEPKPPVEYDEMRADELEVVVPFMRTRNYDRLVDSWLATRPEGARLVLVADRNVSVPIRLDQDGVEVLSSGSDTSTSYAEKLELAYEARAEGTEWFLVVGDDVEFSPGWFEAAVPESRWGHIVGTNDSEEGRTRNPAVARGTHADHFFVRTSYVEDPGASLEGPGVMAPLEYHHWFVDREIIELAKARGVYRHAEESRIIHHHPGYDGDEQARENDPVYMRAVEHSADDEALFLKRAPLIEMQREL